MPYVGRTPTASPIDSSDIPDNSIDASKIVDGAIAVADIADNSITDAKLNSSKLDGIATGANNYSHPATHSTSEIADNAITMAKIADADVVTLKSGRKNLIINGGMQVSQRGTSLTGLQNSPAYLVDRFSYRRGGAWTSFQATMSQEDVTDLPGFSKSVKVATAAAETSSTSSVGISTCLEAQDLISLGLGTSDKKDMTISFWVKSNQTGTYTLWTTLNDQVGDYTHTSSYTVDTADTWEKKTIIIPALTTSEAMTYDNTIGLALYWIYSGKSVATAGWGPNNDWGIISGSNDLSGSTSNYLEITGVQLELGSVATDFEHRSYGEELALCQRFFIAAPEVTGRYTGSSTGIAQIWVDFPNHMRASPTVTTYGIGGYPNNPGYYDKDYVGNVACNTVGRKYGFIVYNLSGPGQFGYHADAEL